MLTAQNVFDFLNQKRIIERIEKINLYTTLDFTSTFDRNIWEAYRSGDYFEFCIEGEDLESFCIGWFCNSKTKNLSTEDLFELTKNLKISQLNELVNMIIETNKL